MPNGLWDWATTSWLPEYKTGFDPLDLIYENYARPIASPLGVTGAGLAINPIRRAAKYINEGTKLKPSTLPVKGNPISSVWDEVKQMALTFGIPGTASSSHGIALAQANLKSTPVRELPGEMWRTIRSLYNPDFAVAQNRKMLGGMNPTEKLEEIKNTLRGMHPTWNDNQINRAARIGLDTYAQHYASANFRDIYELENRGFKTAEVEGGTSLGSTPKRQILTKPIVVGGRNINPLSIQRALFDQPMFGNEGTSTLWKRRAALSELDRARTKGAADPYQQAIDYATNMFGGYGESNPLFGRKSANQAARFILTAPDWTRRHFNLGGKTIRSVADPRTWRDQAYDPYRRYAAYTAAGLGLGTGATAALTGELPDRPQDIFDIELPEKFAGKTGIVRPGFTENDFWKYASSVANNLPFAPGLYNQLYEKGLPDATIEFWRNRVHPLSRSAFDLMFNTDWKGESLYNREKFTRPRKSVTGETVSERPKVLNPGERITKDILRNVLPNAAEAIFTKSTTPSKISDLELYAKLFELPLTFYTSPYRKTESRIDRKLKRLRSRMRGRT